MESSTPVRLTKYIYSGRGLLNSYHTEYDCMEYFYGIHEIGFENNPSNS
jgi:hypothetical protein